MLTSEWVSIITVGKYNRISTPRVLMLDNSPCDVDFGFHPCWNKNVDDDDAGHADVVDNRLMNYGQKKRFSRWRHLEF